MIQTLRQAPLPIVLLVASFLCPTELSLDMAGLRLPPHRLAILLLIFPAIWRIISRPDTRFRMFDFFFIAYAVNVAYVYMLHGEGNAGLIYGGSVALEAAGAYLIARAYIRDWYSFHACLNVLVLACIVALCFALPETLFGAHFTHDFLQSVTGHVHPRKIEHRLMFTRAYGTFDHPIHLGTFAASIFALVWFSGKRRLRRIRDSVLVSATTLCALSSAPILCIFTQIGLIFWDKFTRNLKGRIALTLIGLVLLYILVSMVATRSPVMIIATGFTIDSWTGFYRTQIWYHGMQNVFANPWIGIGLGDWERAWWMYSDSVDAFWLVTMMRTGVPSLIVLLVGILLLVAAVTMRARKYGAKHVDDASKAWLMSLLAICLAACTVHFWNVSNSYFFFLLGLGGWFGDPMPKRFRDRIEAKRAARANRRRAGRRRSQPVAGPQAPRPVAVPQYT